MPSVVPQVRSVVPQVHILYSCLMKVEKLFRIDPRLKKKKTRSNEKKYSNKEDMKRKALAIIKIIGKAKQKKQQAVIKSKT